MTEFKHFGGFGKSYVVKKFLFPVLKISILTVSIRLKGEDWRLKDGGLRGTAEGGYPHLKPLTWLYIVQCTSLYMAIQVFL